MSHNTYGRNYFYMEGTSMKLLIDDYPMIFLPKLAMKLGVNEALFLHQVHYWLTKSKYHFDGRRWIFNTYESWHKQFPYWSLSTIRRMIKKLHDQGILLIGNYNRKKFDRKNWYSIDYEVINSMFNNEQF